MRSIRLLRRDPKALLQSMSVEASLLFVGSFAELMPSLGSSFYILVWWDPFPIDLEKA